MYLINLLKIVPEPKVEPNKNMAFEGVFSKRTDINGLLISLIN